MAEQVPFAGKDDSGLVNGGDVRSPAREPEVITLSDSETSDCESDKNDEGEQKKHLECPVCIQQCVHPARLPCGHIFCFLCVKGIAHGSKRCAMCRHPIPPDFLENPDLVYPDTDQPDETSAETYQWYYEGRNGWWQYDQRACLELETAYQAGEPTCELLIAGYLYTVDFTEMLQSRRSEPARRRKIKRDLSTCPKKGVAGLRQPQPSTVNDISAEMAKLSLNSSQL